MTHSFNFFTLYLTFVNINDFFLKFYLDLNPTSIILPAHVFPLDMSL